MAFTLPKPLIPILTKPLVPGWLAIALLAGQYLFLSSGNNPSPECVLTIQKVHPSTYMKEYQNLDVIKLNMATKCNFPQEYSEISAEITQEFQNGKKVSAARFVRVVRVPSPNSPFVTQYSNLTVPCLRGAVVSYSAIAQGTVKLKSGIVLEVASKTPKPGRTNCRIAGE
jgi:hypothetical protein